MNVDQKEKFLFCPVDKVSYFERQEAFSNFLILCQVKNNF